MALAIQCMSAQTVTLEDQAWPGIRKATVGLSGVFSEADVITLARNTLAKRPASEFLDYVIIGPTGGLFPPKPANADYVIWRTTREKYISLSSEIAELIAYKENALLRIRDRQGRITKHVLGGADPLHLNAGGLSFDIVYFAFPRTSPPRVDVYVRSSKEPTPQAGLELFRVLESWFPPMDVWVFVRSDSLFVHEPTYPLLNPFEFTFSTPSPEEFQQTRTLICAKRTKKHATPTCGF